MLGLIFIIAFVLCFAIGSLCVLIGHELINTYNAPFNRFYFYYLIAFLVFAIYAFWGQIGMQALLASVETTYELEHIVKGVFPLFGLPFFVIAMLMMPQMGFALVGQPVKAKTHYFHLIMFLFVAGVLFGCYGLGAGTWAFLQKNTFLLALLLAIEMLYLLFFISIVLHQLKKTPSKKSKTITRFTLLLFAGLLFRGGSLAFNEVTEWALPFLVLIYFLSHLLALWYLRQRSDSLFEPISAERPDTNKKFELYEKYQITPREREVIEQICLGKTNQQIADTLFISLQTVKDHTHRIYTKVGINSRLKLVRMVNE